MKWWIVVWILTSSALVLWASTVDQAIYVAAVYIGANLVGVAITATRVPPVPRAFMTVVGWCAALQLPVLLVAFFDPNEMKARVDAQTGEGTSGEPGGGGPALPGWLGSGRRHKRGRSRPDQ